MARFGCLPSLTSVCASTIAASPANAKKMYMKTFSSKSAPMPRRWFSSSPKIFYTEVSAAYLSNARAQN